MNSSEFLPSLSERELAQCLLAADATKRGAVIDVLPETKTIRLYNRMWDHTLSDGPTKMLPFFSVYRRVDCINDFAVQFPADDVLPLMFAKSRSKKAKRKTSNHKRRLSKREKKLMKRNRVRKPPTSAPPIDYLTDRESILFVEKCGVTMAWRIVTTQDVNGVERLIAIEGMLMHVPKPDDENAIITTVVDQDEQRILAAFKHIIAVSQQLVEPPDGQSLDTNTTDKPAE